jgi:hypothetical protein
MRELLSITRYFKVQQQAIKLSVAQCQCHQVALKTEIDRKTSSSSCQLINLLTAIFLQQIPSHKVVQQLQHQFCRLNLNSNSPNLYLRPSKV